MIFEAHNFERRHIIKSIPLQHFFSNEKITFGRLQPLIHFCSFFSKKFSRERSQTRKKNTISPFLFFRAIGKKARKYEIEKPRRKAIRVLPTPSPPPRIEKIYSKRRFWWISIGREGAEGEGEKHWRAWNEKIHLSGDEPLIAICVEIGSHFSKFNHCGVGWRGVRGVIYRRNMGWG